MLPSCLRPCLPPALIVYLVPVCQNPSLARSLPGPPESRSGFGCGEHCGWPLPGACLEGEVALADGLQTSAVGCPVEYVASVTQALEAAGGVDADVVTGPVKGTLVNVCGHRETGRGVSMR